MQKTKREETKCLVDIDNVERKSKLFFVIFSHEK